ncbi:MAG: hypothetical protein WAN43_18295 [Rhodomicrobium sp.]
MTEPSIQRRRDLPAALLRNKWVQLFAALLALLELYNHGAIPAFITTQKGVETRAIAENAALRQKAEAELAEWKSITETQIATYAGRKQRADARKATADARKAQSEQIIAGETAKNSAVKAKAEAEALEGEAAIKEQQVIVERERANQAERLNQAQATDAEYKAIFAAMGNWIANSDAKPNVTCSLFGNC